MTGWLANQEEYSMKHISLTLIGLTIKSLDQLLPQDIRLMWTL